MPNIQSLVALHFPHGYSVVPCSLGPGLSSRSPDNSRRCSMISLVRLGCLQLAICLAGWWYRRNNAVSLVSRVSDWQHMPATKFLPEVSKCTSQFVGCQLCCCTLVHSLRQGPGSYPVAWNHLLCCCSLQVFWLSGWLPSYHANFG